MNFYAGPTFNFHLTDHAIAYFSKRYLLTKSYICSRIKTTPLTRLAENGLKYGYICKLFFCYKLLKKR